MNGTLFSYEKIIAIVQILLGLFLLFFTIYNEFVITGDLIEKYGIAWNDISLFGIIKRNGINFTLSIVALLGGFFTLKNNLKGWMLSLVFFISGGSIIIIRFTQLLYEGFKYDDNLGMYFISFVILVFFLISFYLTRTKFILKYSPRRNNWFFILVSVVFFVTVQLILVLESIIAGMLLP